jgi:hypothetical protein
MNTVFSLLFTPIGRYAIIAVVVMMMLGGIYAKIRSDAIAEVEAAATSDALRRTENALRAGDSVDVSTGGLRQPDKFQRND